MLDITILIKLFYYQITVEGLQKKVIKVSSLHKVRLYLLTNRDELRTKVHSWLQFTIQHRDIHNAY